MKKIKGNTRNLTVKGTHKMSQNKHRYNYQNKTQPKRAKNTNCKCYK